MLLCLFLFCLFKVVVINVSMFVSVFISLLHTYERFAEGKQTFLFLCMIMSGCCIVIIIIAVFNCNRFKIMNDHFSIHTRTTIFDTHMKSAFTRNEKKIVASF